MLEQEGCPMTLTTRATWLAAITALSVIFAHTPVEAASFNCRYAKTPAENAICKDRGLSRQDERMASIYFGLQNDLSSRRARQLKRGQTDWLAERDDCGFNKSCLRRSYRNRIAEMCDIADYEDLSCDDY